MITSTYTVRKYIKDLCQKHNVNSNLILVGYGTTYSKQGNRYIYDIKDGLVNNPNAQYVAKYFRSGDFFLIWKVLESKRRSCFSASYHQVQDALVRLKELTKSIEYSGWGEETVKVIPKSDIEKFIASL